MSDEADDRPITLDEACETVFGGAIKPASLRSEARRGNLVMMKIGRRYFVTRAALEDMMDKCRVEFTEATSIAQPQSETLEQRARIARSALEMQLNAPKKSPPRNRRPSRFGGED